jgi:hypothetical protein
LGLVEKILQKYFVFQDIELTPILKMNHGTLVSLQFAFFDISIHFLRTMLRILLRSSLAMKLNELFQLWSNKMAKKPNKIGIKNKASVISIELVPVIENEVEYLERVEEVQVILTQMYLRLLRRGRPLKNEEEELYAA